MYVCCCLAVTETEVRSAIEEGASNRAEVTLACRAGGDCGSCHGMIEQMIDDHRDARREDSGPLVPLRVPTAAA